MRSRTTIKVIAAFAGAVAIGLLAVGPLVMTALLGDKGFHYGRVGLALVGIGMGLHLTAGTLNQAALARGRATARRRRLADRGGAVRRVHAVGHDQQPGDPSRGFLLHRRADPVRPVLGRLPPGSAPARRATASSARSG